MKPPTRPGALSPGFTLVELLVVIGILAVLTGILVPVVNRARAKARQAACVSHLRQLGMALQMYCQDYDERLPPWAVASAPTTGKVWGQVLLPYTADVRVYFCPSMGRPQGAGTVLDDSPFWGPTHNYLMELVYCSYGYNAMYLSNARLGSVASPTETIAIVDTTFSGYADHGWGYFAAFPPSIGGHAMLADRHDGGANVTFLDGHTKWHRKEFLLADDSLWDLE